MTDKQTFVTILGGALAFFAGGFLMIPIQLIYEALGGHVDGGDDGWGLLAIALMIVSAILGFVLTAKWARRRFPEFQA
jgi:hypothetical protein